MTQPRFGRSAVLRVAGLPIRFWLSGSNPALFERVRHYDIAAERRAATAARVADEIGRQLVPDPAFGRADRAMLLDARRRLHRGESLGSDQRASLRTATAQGAVPHDELCADLVELADQDRSFTSEHGALEQSLVDEQSRLLGLAEEFPSESPVATAILQTAHEGAGGPNPSLGPRQRRRRIEHAWRRISRSSTSSTPRGWFSHVALLDVAPDAAASGPAVGSAFDAKWTENVRAGRPRGNGLPPSWPGPRSLVGLNPLYWNDGERRVTFVLDDLTEPTRVIVRRTDFLESVCAEVAAGAKPFDEIAATLASSSPDERVALGGFIRHLVGIGILQSAEPPKASLERDATPGASGSRRRDEDDDQGGWTDVYRRASAGQVARRASELQEPILQALRLLALLRGEDAGPSASAPSEGGRTWEFRDLLRSEIEAAERGEVSTRAGHDAPPGALAESGRSLFGLALAAHLDQEPGSAFHVDSDLLDLLGAPPAKHEWPFDCLVQLPRPGSGYTAVLDQVWPPGVLDARFVETLTELHGTPPHVEAYRAFLARIEELTGVLMVELLAPPLTDGAANAVRRPVYVGTWTGDPLAATYFPVGTAPDRFIPLDAIQLRRRNGGLQAEVDGRPIWPMHHATRSISPPWDRLARILLASAPDVLPWGYASVEDSWGLLPEHRALPRILVDGIVVFPARWRLGPDQLWDFDASMLTKLRALVRLRDHLALPRWVHVSGVGADAPLACDLESILAVRAIERASIGASEVRFVEMVPSPDEFLVEDLAHRPGDRVLSAVQLRFPIDADPAEVAARIAPRILTSLGRTEPYVGEPLPLVMCRDPPTSDLLIGTGDVALSEV
jgi:hypothetical protein